ncbi:Cell division cycle-associated 7-like protein [Bienertia sinuspersici]
MAVLSTPIVVSEKENNNGTKKMQQNMDTQKEEVIQKQPRRSKDPGIRVVGARIYDSQNGKTCHQCRQKTMDFTAGCKNMRGDKQCTIKFCHKCLLNRYGEKAEEMEALDNWNCPKKKKGHKPTGILVHAAKATGFSSVSELLHVKGHEASQELIAKSNAVSPKESAVSNEGMTVVSPKKRGKENAFDGSCNTKLSPQSLPASLNDKKAKKPKREVVEGPKKKDEVKCSPSKNTMVIALRSPRKSNVTEEASKKEVVDGKDKVRRSPRKKIAPQEVTKTEEKMISDKSVKETKKVKKTTKVQEEPNVKSRKLQKEKDTVDEPVVDIVLPSGCMLTNVAGVDVMPDDAGYALQFLEFCSTFGEVLKIQKGHPESVLRDIYCGRNTRKGKFSSTVQFLTQLVSFILKDLPDEEEEEEEKESLCLSPSNDKDSWIQSLKRCLAESELELEDFPENCFDKGYHGYEMLDPSQKLKLLTFLCDESLSVKEMRSWIDEQNLKFVEKSKEEKESLNAARKKEKEEAKRKLQEGVAKLVLAKNSAPLTISEHDAIIAKIKAETEHARKEFEALDVMPKKRQRSYAVRTDSVFLDDSGHAFWRLACLDDQNLLLQDVGVPEQVDYKDKWFSFNAEEIEVVEKYISSVRLQKYKRMKLADKAKMKSNSDLEVDSSSNDDSPPAITDI